MGRPAAAQAFSPAAKPSQHRVDDLVEGHPAVDVQLGGEPHLGIDHRVGGQVFDAFVGDAVERLGRLHHRHGV